MGSSEKTEYCAFTKAVEHLGDRWSLLIVRELALFGPQGFNTLATGLPGHVSRSVLTDKLRKLEEIGIVARDPSAASRSAPYCLTPAGEQLMPTLKSLWAWAEHWVPEDPATAQRDPTFILWWLRHRDRGSSPPRAAGRHRVRAAARRIRSPVAPACRRRRAGALPGGSDDRRGAIRLRRGRCRRPLPHRPRLSLMDGRNRGWVGSSLRQA